MQTKEFLVTIWMLIAVFLYMIGDHNVDLAWNMLRMAYQHGINYELLYDTTYLGVKMDYDQIYKAGTVQKAFAFLILIGSILFYITSS